MRRGDIVRVNLTDAQPPEMGKLRPAVILSNDAHNAVLGAIAVVPLSTRPPGIWPLRVALPETDGLQRSFAVVPGIRQVNKQRVVEKVGVLSQSALTELEDACFAYLGE